MDIAAGIGALSATLGSPPPPPDDAGRYVFRFEDDLELRVFSVAGQPILEGVVQALPADAAECERLFRGLLRVSLARVKERREALTLDEDSKEIRLFRRIATETLEDDHFVEVAEDFLNELEFRRRRAGSREQAELPRSPFSFMR